MTIDLPTWEKLLTEAVMNPGTISTAYRAFHNYSTGNQLLAMWQCVMRDIQPGPIATFPGWKAKGRSVCKGQKAISLVMPVTCKIKSDKPDSEKPDGEAGEPGTFTRFIFRPNWFVLSQTNGAEYVAESSPEWDEAKALAELKIERVEFDHLNGNIQGYARERQVAVSPIAFAPLKTLFHELGHVVLGHCAEGLLSDSEHTPRSLKEAEAESVALLCLESLGLPGSDHCRGYIQRWYSEGNIPERSAQKIFKAADQILKAGTATKGN